MRSRKPIRAAVVAAIAVLLGVGAWYEWGPRHVPPDQPPLTVVTRANLTAFEARFNAHPQSPRLLLFFSPT